MCVSMTAPASSMPATLGGGLAPGVASGDATSAIPPTSTGGVAPDVLQGLAEVVSQLEGIVASLSGTMGGGGAVAGAGSVAPAGGNPTQMAMPMPADTKAGKHGKHHGTKGVKGNPNQGPGRMKGHMSIIPRSAPENPERAGAILDAVVQSFAHHGRAGLDFKNNQTHGYLSAAERREFTRRYPGLPAPNALVFEGKGTKPLGVVYRTSRGQFDLGMGARHQHHDGNDQMQHVWFTPGNLNLAFSDVEHGMTGSTARYLKQAGF